MAHVVVTEAIVVDGDGRGWRGGRGRRGGGGVGADAVQHRGTDEGAVSAPGQQARCRVLVPTTVGVFRDQRKHYRYMACFVASANVLAFRRFS